jgi:hypothetical protein
MNLRRRKKIREIVKRPDEREKKEGKFNSAVFAWRIASHLLFLEVLLTIAAFYLLRNTARSMNSPEPGLMEAFAAVTQAVRTATRQSTLLLPPIT